MGIFLLIYYWKSFANDTIMDIFGKTNEVSEGIYPVTEKLPSFSAHMLQISGNNLIFLGNLHT